MPTWLIPIVVLGGLLVLLGVFAVLARVQGGRYLRPLLALLMKVPLFRRLIAKASRKALERENPELASAIQKIERAGGLHDPQRAQAALSRLTAGERRAYLDAVGEQMEQGQVPEPANRAQRRQMQKLQKGTRRRG